MGLRMPIQKVWPRHRGWVRSHGCCVPDCRSAGAVFAHLHPSADLSPALVTPYIFWIIHSPDDPDEHHRIGTDAFNKKYSIDLWALAAEFARRSPDWEMRASLKLVSLTQPSSLSS